jgi:plastocyanin
MTWSWKLCQSTLAGWLLASIFQPTAFSQEVEVQAHVELSQAGAQKAAHRTSGYVVIWLNPEAGSKSSPSLVPPGHFRVEQKNKSFSPHLLVVPLGSTVDFPNLDPFFHNVFSQFNGKRFDLGLYEAGSSRRVLFDHEGISYLFCNIHSQMAAVIVTLATPYYSIATGSGVVQVRGVPAGDYEMHVWAEGVDAKRLEGLSHRVHVSLTQTNLGTIELDSAGPLPHKNKFGEDYKLDAVPTY